MKFYNNVTMDELKLMEIPTYNRCEHYYIEPHVDTNQTIVIKVGENKYMTVCIMPNSDCVDVKVFGEHKSIVLDDSTDSNNTVHTFCSLKD